MVLLGTSGLIFSDFTRNYYALLSLTGPYWAPLSPTGPYWALLVLTGPYWALLALTLHLSILTDGLTD